MSYSQHFTVSKHFFYCLLYQRVCFCIYCCRKIDIKEN